MSEYDKELESDSDEVGEADLKLGRDETKPRGNPAAPEASDETGHRDRGYDRPDR